MQVVKKQVTKRKWSLSNLMTAVHILLNSYINLYDFLNLPEGQWLRIIQNRSPKDEISPQLELFTQEEGANFENYKTNAYLQAVNQQNKSNPDFYRTAIIYNCLYIPGIGGMPAQSSVPQHLYRRLSHRGQGPYLLLSSKSLRVPYLSAVS